MGNRIELLRRTDPQVDIRHNLNYALAFWQMVEDVALESPRFYSGDKYF
jgi:hypothetical protein